jgi:hypothetical protein
MVQVCYYTRRGCHLCDVMLEELLPLLRGRAEIQLRDVDSNPEWLQRYDIRIPVVEVNGEIVSEYPLDRPSISRFLAGLPEIEGQTSE